MLIKHSIMRVTAFLTILLLTSGTPILGYITSNSQNDPYPVFTTLDPQTYLQTREKLRLQGYTLDVNHNEWFGLSISPFAQNSNSTRFDCLATVECGQDCTDVDTCLGNIHGRWSMIALLFGETPACATLPPALQAARDCLFPDFPEGTPIDNPLYIDRQQLIGFFDVPMRYKKRGVRFDFKGQISKDFGISFNCGLADICQTIAFRNRTTPSSGTITINSCVTVDACCLNRTLMDDLKTLAPQICLDIDDFHKFSIEDLRAGIYWRHAYAINSTRPTWEEFLLIPFIHLEGSAAVGAERNYNQFASLSFGSNDHNAIGISTGLNINFTETIEVGGEGGVTHFFDRDICSLPVPTSVYQSGIYPYSTAVNIQPGNNWYFGLKMNAYHFMGDLSFYFEYLLIDHEKDCIKLKKFDPAFKPDVLRELSDWKSQLANIGFNYDISPHVSLGFLWQTPLPSRNTYRSTTVMLSFNAQY